MTAFPHHPSNHSFIPEGVDLTYADAFSSAQALRNLQTENQVGLSRRQVRPAVAPLGPELKGSWIPPLPGARRRLQRAKAGDLRISIPETLSVDAKSDAEAQVLRVLGGYPLVRFYSRIGPEQSLCCVVLFCLCFAFTCTLPFAFGNSSSAR